VKRRLLAVLVAFALAAVGCLAVVAYVRGADQRALAGREAAWVLIAKQRIPAGTTGADIRDAKLVDRVAMPAATVPDGAVAQIDDQLAALTVTADLQPSQLLLRGAFGEATTQSGGLPLPDGKLAVSVELSAAGRVAGFVRPGSKVAIFDTFTVRAGTSRLPAGTRLTESFDAERPLGPAMTWITEKWTGSTDRDADLHAGMTVTLDRIKAAAESI